MTNCVYHALMQAFKPGDFCWFLNARPEQIAVFFQSVDKFVQLVGILCWSLTIKRKHFYDFGDILVNNEPASQADFWILDSYQQVLDREIMHGYHETPCPDWLMMLMCLATSAKIHVEQPSLEPNKNMIQIVYQHSKRAACCAVWLSSRGNGHDGHASFVKRELCSM